MSALMKKLTKRTKKQPARVASQGAKPLGLAAIFPQRLWEIRAQRRLTQEGVARAAGLSTAYISMLERGSRTPPLETVDALAKALKVDPLELLRKAA